MEDDAHRQRHPGHCRPHLQESPALNGNRAGYADAAKAKVCYQEMDDYYAGTVRRGRTRDGRVYMPPFEGTLTQEAIWSIRTYLEDRRNSVK